MSKVFAFNLFKIPKKHSDSAVFEALDIVIWWRIPKWYSQIRRVAICCLTSINLLNNSKWFT